MSTNPDYLVCYDITNIKRLQKLARALEKLMIRIQFSIFFIPEASQVKLFEIIGTINDIIDAQRDDVRIYTVVEKGYRLGRGVDIEDALSIY